MKKVLEPLGKTASEQSDQGLYHWSEIHILLQGNSNSEVIMFWYQ